MTPRYMDISRQSRADGYESLYREIDSPLMRKIRRETYGEDIGLHSWGTAQEVRADVQRLNLSSSSRIADLGCGPCGPLTFILATVGCRGTGIELSPSALRAGQARAVSLGVASLLSVQEADLNESLPFPSGSFDAAMSIDVVLHLRDRLGFFREVAKIVRPGGRFLFTDAGVVTGAVSNEDVRNRSPRGYTQFVPPGWNERLLESAGLQLLETEDRTPSVFRYATNKLAAMEKYRAELERVSGADDFEREQDYLKTLAELSRSRIVSRMMYLAEAYAAA
jgi:SAM-dependent methyltransferase